jgi:general stress protein 26
MTGPGKTLRKKHMIPREDRMKEETREDNIRRLGSLLEGFEVAMLTTLQTRDGSLHSRPMMTQEMPFDGTLNFLTKFSTDKIDEIRAGSQVNLTYVSPSIGRYISISGAAYILRDRIRIEAMWSEIYRAWFPQGIDEPDLALLRVDVIEAEIWDAASRIEGESIKFA